MHVETAGARVVDRDGNAVRVLLMDGWMTTVPVENVLLFGQSLNFSLACPIRVVSKSSISVVSMIERFAGLYSCASHAVYSAGGLVLTV